MLKRHASSESWELSWNVQERKNYQVRIAESQPQEHVTVNLIICLASVFLLSSGLLLIGVSIWAVVRRIPYYYILDIRVDIPYFTIPAGFLCLPSFWITAAIHNNVDRHQFLPLLIFLMLTTTILALTGSCLGIMYKPELDNLTAVTFVSVTEDVYLNDTLRHTMKQYEMNPLYHFAWDRMQTQLKCCGVENVKDWLHSAQDIPDACCIGSVICNATNVFERGCLESLSRDLVWSKNFLTSHCYMIAVIQLTFTAVAIAIYCSKRLERTSITSQVLT